MTDTYIYDRQRDETERRDRMCVSECVCVCERQRDET